MYLMYTMSGKLLTRQIQIGGWKIGGDNHALQMKYADQRQLVLNRTLRDTDTPFFGATDGKCTNQHYNHTDEFINSDTIHKYNLIQGEETGFENNTVWRNVTVDAEHVYQIVMDDYSYNGNPFPNTRLVCIRKSDESLVYSKLISEITGDSSIKYARTDACIEGDHLYFVTGGPAIYLLKIDKRTGTLVYKSLAIDTTNDPQPKYSGSDARVYNHNGDRYIYFGMRNTAQYGRLWNSQTSNPLDPAQFTMFGGVYCMKESGNGAQVQWVYNTAPRQIQAGELVPDECFRPDETTVKVKRLLTEDYTFSTNQTDTIILDDKTIEITFVAGSVYKTGNQYSCIDKSTGGAITVNGTELLGQPVTRIVQKGSQEPLTAQEAYSLNYFGASVWSSSMVIDEKLGRLYFTTGNANYVPIDEDEAIHEDKTSLVEDIKMLGGVTDPDEYRAKLAQIEANRNARKEVRLSPRGNRFLFDSIVSVNLLTGTSNWALKAYAYDAWHVGWILATAAGIQPTFERYYEYFQTEALDVDFGEGPMLLTKESGERRISCGNKGGRVFSVNPDNTMLNNQYISDDNGASFNAYPDDIYTRRIGWDGVLGGSNYGSCADNEFVYIRQANSHPGDGVTPLEWMKIDGTIIPKGTGYLVKYDPFNDVVVWESEFEVGTGLNGGGPNAVVNDVVLSAQRGISLHAFDKNTGERLKVWSATGISTVPVADNGILYAGCAFGSSTKIASLKM